MSHLVAAVTTAKFVGHGRIEDDFVDRLHYIFTSTMLIVFSVTISWKQFGGQPIECMVPDDLNENYAEMYCWAKDTYFVPWDTDIPEEHEDRRTEEINYYQWVPFFLLIQAASFQLPFLYWQNVASHSGIRVHHLVREAVSDKNMDTAVRKATVQVLSTHVDNALRFHRRVYRRKALPNMYMKAMHLPYTSAYITIMYLLVKLLYTVNVLLQFFSLNYFLLGNRSSSWTGLHAFGTIMNGTNWEHSTYFPRVTVCDMRKRTLGQLQRFSFQCTLSINLLNEKIFVFLWLWYVILLAASAVSFAYWATVTLSPCFRRWFIVRHLELADMPFDPDQCPKMLHKFVFEYLHVDGAFVLRMLTAHAGIMMGTDIIAMLWNKRYKLADENEAKWTPVAPETATAYPKHNPFTFRADDDDDDDTEAGKKSKRKQAGAEDTGNMEQLNTMATSALAAAAAEVAAADVEPHSDAGHSGGGEDDDDNWRPSGLDQPDSRDKTHSYRTAMAAGAMGTAAARLHPAYQYSPAGRAGEYGVPLLAGQQQQAMASTSGWRPEPAHKPRLDPLRMPATGGYMAGQQRGAQQQQRRTAFNLPQQGGGRRR